MAAETKKRKFASPPPRRPITSLPVKNEPAMAAIATPMVHMAEGNDIQLRIQLAKNFAVAQAQQEGCTGNFRILDSPYGNFLVPVIPSRAELGG